RSSAGPPRRYVRGKGRRMWRIWDGVRKKNFLFWPKVITNVTTAPWRDVMAKLIPPSSSARRILLADDEEMVRKAIRLILRFSGYEIVEAVDGEDAVRKYLAASPPFDLIL